MREISRRDFLKGSAAGIMGAALSGMTGGAFGLTALASENGYDHEAIENAGDITITMMVSGTTTENGFETETLPGLISAKWPNVTVEVTKLPDDNYYTSLKTKLASGECPDIILTQPMYAGSNSCYALAEAGYLTALDDLDSTANLSDTSAVTYNDELVTFPNGVSILGVYYNKDMFAEVGIESEPTTWDEFLEDCQILQDAGYQPITMGDKDQYVLQFGLYQIACNEVYAFNADYDEQLRTGETAFTDEGTWDTVLTMYNELYENSYIDGSQSLGIGASQAITQFIDGEAAMTIDGSFNATAIMAEGEAGSFERGYFPIPAANGDTYTATCLSSGYSIYSGSSYIDECKEILDYLYDGESEAWDAFVATGKFIMTYGNGADEFENYELFEPFIELMNEGKAFHWCNQAWPSGTETTMEELFSEMIGGQGTTVEDITEGMQEKFEDLLED
ncbi:MAG: substrate-binding domain-containing protein [Lachnospiraceae bacterium]|nr:substrate-binding domain-containing protein [Lachnospiraceae bacterium]